MVDMAYEIWDGKKIRLSLFYTNDGVTSWKQGLSSSSLIHICGARSSSFPSIKDKESKPSWNFFTLNLECHLLIQG